MAEMNVNKTQRRLSIRHRGRGAQVWIYLGKLLRMFVYQNDWKVLPMAALIAGLVGMVVRNRLFINMEGALMGGFAMVMVCIWNGCFNSIQVIVRERDVIKREHRSGMHISSYICAHMIYQALLCLLQTGITLYVTKTVGVKYPTEGLFTSWFIVDFGISMFLITYASDMMSLWISTLAKTTTTAMTIMPFVLIFQLVFAGGLLSLPAWTERITPFTISNPAVKVIAAQGGYNQLPTVAIWNKVDKMRGKQVDATVTPRQAVEFLQNKDNPVIAKIRDMQISRVFTIGELTAMLEKSETFQALKEEHLMEDVTLGDALKYVSENESFKDLQDVDFNIPGLTVGKLLNDITEMDKLKPLLDTPVAKLTTVGDALNTLESTGLLEQYKDQQVGMDITLGEAVDRVTQLPEVQPYLDKQYEIHTTIGEIINMIGEDKVKDILQNGIADASHDAMYDYTKENIVDYWIRLFMFVLAFAALATIPLEFIDKDKR